MGKCLGKLEPLLKEPGLAGEVLRLSQALEPYFSALIFQHAATWFQNFKGFLGENMGKLWMLHAEGFPEHFEALRV